MARKTAKKSFAILEASLVCGESIERICDRLRVSRSYVLEVLRAAPLKHIAHKEQVVFKVHTKMDSSGKHSFAIFWWDEDFHLGPRERGQEFHAELRWHFDKWVETGRECVVDDSAITDKKGSWKTRGRSAAR